MLQYLSYFQGKNETECSCVMAVCFGKPKKGELPFFMYVSTYEVEACVDNDTEVGDSLAYDLAGRLTQQWRRTRVALFPKMLIWEFDEDSARDKGNLRKKPVGTKSQLWPKIIFEGSPKLEYCVGKMQFFSFKGNCAPCLLLLFVLRSIWKYQPLMRETF